MQEAISSQFKRPSEISPFVSVAPLSTYDMGWKHLGSPTVPFEASVLPDDDEACPIPALLAHSTHDTAEQVVSRLSEAANQITAEEAGVRRFVRSRSARLRPLRDISADIQRQSTPHLSMRDLSELATQPEGRVLVTPTPPLQHANTGPWFGETDGVEDENEGDPWANATDPLLARGKPTKTEAARIEQADIQRIEREEQETLPYSALKPRRQPPSFWRLAFSGLALLALIILSVDGLLLVLAFHSANHTSASDGGAPTLTLSATAVNPGQTVSIQLTHFAPKTTVVLTHDVQEILLPKALALDVNGQATASFVVDASWNPGFHLIVGEDVATRNTASVMLQVNGTGPSLPPHLTLDSPSLDLRSAVQGANTLRPLLLRNSGSGSITWSASSDQPWLLVAPQQGNFSRGQTISVAAQRSALAPGKYTGTLTLFSSAGNPERLRVSMQVDALPPNAGPMISLVPPVLSFTTMDGSPAPVTQTVTLSNPGQQELQWSLSTGATSTTALQSADQTPASTQAAQSDPTLSTNMPSWLSADRTSGTLAPGQAIQLLLTARAQNLLPGAYMETVTFSSAHNAPAYDTPQIMNVALTIQPHCGLVTSSGNLQFTAVAGQSNPSSQALNLNATSSCANQTLNWQALHSASWITLNPASGQISSTSGGVTSIGVNTAGLAPGNYSSAVTLQTGQSTQTVIVQLTLQPHPAALEPILGASPLSLNFSAIQGQADPTGQVITITNNGTGPLTWQTNIAPTDTNWLAVAPNNGTVLPGQTGQATVSVIGSSLTPGTLSGQFTLSALDAHGAPASGSPQTIAVSLVIQPPCTLAQPSQSRLLFSALAGGANPPTQTVSLTGTGSCTWPLQWNTSVSPAADWLTLTSSTFLTNRASQQDIILVGIDTQGLQPGTYTTHVHLSAVDASGTQAQNSPQTFVVTLHVLQPCTLQPLPSQINLNALQGQSASVSQTLTLQETGSCSGGVSWTALSNATSNAWLSLSPGSGTDTSSGSTITVSASAGSLVPGSYTGQITVSASNNGMVLQGSPQTLTVTFQVAGYSVSGSIVSCGGPAPTCTAATSLSSASVSLLKSDGTVVATVTADASGNFAFSNIPQGSYTVKANGIVGTISYSGTTPVTVSGNTSGISVQTFSS